MPPQAWQSRPVPGAVGGFDRLVGGFGTLDKPKPVMTVGSFWPYATTLFDYVRRAMPFQAPQSLTADEVYAVSAYILFMNNIVPEDAVMDAQKLPGQNAQPRRLHPRRSPARCSKPTIDEALSPFAANAARRFHPPHQGSYQRRTSVQLSSSVHVRGGVHVYAVSLPGHADALAAVERRVKAPSEVPELLIELADGSSMIRQVLRSPLDHRLHHLKLTLI